MHLNKVKAQAVAHKGHWMAHLFYLGAAAMEGHLVYSTMAALTAVFMVGCALIGDVHAD